MKKKVISGIFALAFLATVGFGVNKSMSDNANLNELALANVEALANGEVIIGVACMETCSWCWCYYPPIFNDPYDYWADGEPYI